MVLVLSLFKVLHVQVSKVIVWDIQELTYTPPPNVVFYKVDLTSGSEIDAAAERVRSEIGHVTIVINNAGTGIGKTILGSTERTVKLTFNVNAVAPFLVTKAFLPHMIKTNHGHVLTIASLASFTTPAQMVDYCASKPQPWSFLKAFPRNSNIGTVLQVSETQWSIQCG